jgi:cytochrome c oxidase assembly protein Cox11
VREWDERRLNALSRPEQEAIARELDQLHRAGKIPLLEGEETFELVREGRHWRVFLDWARGVRVRFDTASQAAIPLELTVSPVEVLVKPGERVRVTVRAKNLSAREIVTRVGHRIEPKAEAHSLALLRCPLFFPVTLAPGQVEEFLSEFVLAKDLAPETIRFDVTYVFRLASRSE